MLVILGLGIAVLLLEAGLQLASLALRTFGDRSGGVASGGRRLVLCVGDSHTYGTVIPREQAYPAQLQAYLNRVDPDGRYRVVNRGIPGLNSAQLASLLPIWLREQRPDLVVVWIGANNWWNREDPAHIRDRAAVDRRLRRLLSGSRLYRVWQAFRVRRLLEREPRQRGVPSQISLARERFAEARFLEVTQRDLSAIRQLLAEVGQPWLLVTYPQAHPIVEPRFGHVMALHARAAAAVAGRWRDVPVVHTPDDLQRTIAARPDARLVCAQPPGAGKPCLLLESMGLHPTGILYHAIAESIGDRILSILGCYGKCGAVVP